MKAPMKNRNIGVPQTRLSLQQLVSRLLVNFQPVAVRQRSFILNDVPGDFWVNSDENILASVIGSLFSAVINRTKNACIHVSASTYENMVIVKVKDSSNVCNAGIPQELEKVQPLAEQLGGFITINNQLNDTTTVTFSFFNPLIAA